MGGRCRLPPARAVPVGSIQAIDAVVQHPRGAKGGGDGLLSWPLVGRARELERVDSLLAAGGPVAALLHGPAGVGKSRLAEECFRLATSRGRPGGRVRATSGAAATPLGALVPLLPPEVLETRFDPVALFSTVARVLRGVPDGPYVLLVDDIHLLDLTSATLLTQLLDADAISLVATVRTGEALPEPLADLWLRPVASRIDLVDLSAEDVDSLLHLALGGPVDGSTFEQLWAASRGNALFIRELVLGALASGALSEERGVWRLSRALPATPRLVELVEARIGGVAGPGRQALDLLALREPIGLGELAQSVGHEALEALEVAGLVRIQLDGRREQVSLSHPLHGEALRARLPVMTRRRLLLEHATRIEEHGGRRREDPLRVATSRLEATGSADPGLLLAAARLARYAQDFPEVERLARASLTQSPTVEAALLLGEALYEIGSFEQAEDVLAGAGDPLAQMDEELGVQLVAIRVRNLVWGLQRAEEALAVLRDAQERLEDRGRSEELAIEEALILLFSGHPRRAIEALAGQPRSGGRAAAVRAITEVPALIATGRCEAALDEARVIKAAHAELGDVVGVGPAAIYVVYEVHALMEAGRLAEAYELAAEGRRAAAEGGLPDIRMWLALQLGRAALLSGSIRTAQRWLAEAAVLSADAGLHGHRRLVLSFSAVCLACLGDAAGASAAVAEADDLPPFAYLLPEQRLGHAWAAVAAGRPQEARTILLEAADVAASAGWLSSEALLLHDVVRLGDPVAAGNRLGALAEESEGALVAAYASHGRAAVGRDPDGLIAAADSFESLGARLLAAEAATAASSVLSDRGDRRAMRLADRAAALVESCEGARTPGLLTIRSPTPLSRREREVAFLAADGVPSKEIAERLYLSSRTVNNHLQSVYGKLGVASRAELRAALAASRLRSDGGTDAP